MKHQRAGSIPVTVVAAKLPDQWIIRGIGVFRSVESLHKLMEPYTKMFPAVELEWTQYEYLIPHYLVYGSGEIKGWGWPDTGVFLFRCRGGSGEHAVYRDAEKLRDLL